MAASTRVSGRRAARRATERRTASRGKVKLLVAFKTLDADAVVPSGFVRASNLSAIGALLESPDPFVLGESLALELLLDNNRVAPVNAKVIRLDKCAKFYAVGVKFSPVPAKIKRWITAQVEN